MFYLQNTLTRQPTHNELGRVYTHRIVAERAVSKSEESNTFKAVRVDVVEISKSARLYMEAKNRLLNPQASVLDPSSEASALEEASA